MMYGTMSLKPFWILIWHSEIKKFKLAKKYRCKNILRWWHKKIHGHDDDDDDDDDDRRWR